MTSFKWNMSHGATCLYGLLNLRYSGSVIIRKLNPIQIALPTPGETLFKGLDKGSGVLSHKNRTALTSMAFA